MATRGSPTSTCSCLGRTAPPPISTGLGEQWLAGGSFVTGALPARKSAFVPWGCGWGQNRPREGQGEVQSCPRAGQTEQTGAQRTTVLTRGRKDARGACSARGTWLDPHTPCLPRPLTVGPEGRPFSTFYVLRGTSWAMTSSKPGTTSSTCPSRATAPYQPRRLWSRPTRPCPRSLSPRPPSAYPSPPPPSWAAPWRARAPPLTRSCRDWQVRRRSRRDPAPPRPRARPQPRPWPRPRPGRSACAPRSPRRGVRAPTLTRAPGAPDPHLPQVLFPPCKTGTVGFVRCGRLNSLESGAATSASFHSACSLSAAVRPPLGIIWLPPLPPPVRLGYSLRFAEEEPEARF